jgi:hypothetical protein
MREAAGIRPIFIGLQNKTKWIFLKMKGEMRFGI